MSPRRTWLFKALILACLLALCEFLAWGYLRLVIAEGSLQTLVIRQQQIASGSTSSDGASETIHPYLGWVHNPQLDLPESIDGRIAHTNNLGFRDNGPSIVTTSPEELVVAITGGSVAWRFSWEAESALAEQLAAIPQFANRKLRLVRLALPGYKQPQQLIALNYVLALGSDFDAVINIDGFNDAVLSVLENAQQGTAVEYPRSWHARSILIADPRNSSDAWQLLSLRGARQTRARNALASPLRHSCLYQLVWHVRDDLDHRAILDLAQSVSRARKDSFVHHGPPPPQDKQSAASAAADLWLRSSMQMHDICNARGIAYLHCLQPSQYLPETKNFSEHELTFCFTPDQPHAVLARDLFPLLLERSQQLTSHGVPFLDLTGTFRDHPETLYSDPWCHVNAEANRLLAKSIAPRLVQGLEGQN